MEQGFRHLEVRVEALVRALRDPSTPSLLVDEARALASATLEFDLPRRAADELATALFERDNQDDLADAAFEDKCGSPVRPRWLRDGVRRAREAARRQRLEAWLPGPWLLSRRRQLPASRTSRTYATTQRPRSRRPRRRATARAPDDPGPHDLATRSIGGAP